MPTNQNNNQPRWYRYISPYIDSASKTAESIDQRRRAYIKAFKNYVANASEQAQQYGSNAKKQIERYATKGMDEAKKYGSQAADAAKEWGTSAWNSTKDWTKKAYNNVKHDAKLALVYDEYKDPNAKPRKPARPYRKETFPDIPIPYTPVHYTKSLLQEAAQPAVTVVQDAAHKHLYVKPMNALGLPIKERVLNNSDFGERMKSTADSIAVSQLDLQVPDWRERTARGDTVNIIVDGDDYVDNYGGSNKGLLYRTSNPIGQVEHTLGSWKVKATKDYLTHTDTYDFKDITMQPGGGVYNWSRSNGAFTLESQPDIEKMKFHIKRRRMPEWFHKLTGNELQPPYKK